MSAGISKSCFKIDKAIGGWIKFWKNYQSRRLVAKCCIDSLSNKKSFNKTIEVTSSSENKKVSFKKAMQNF